jgi:protein TonB
MRRALDPQSAYRPHASAGSRAASILLTFGATVLIIVMLVEVGLIGPLPREIQPMKLFNLEPPPTPPPARAPSVKAQLDRSAAAPARAQKVPPLNMIILTPKDYAAADIATLPSQRTAIATGDQADAGQDSSASNGPNGEKIYDVEWYRHPTHAELAPYMPTSGPESGSATIACRMIDHYHVEDCRELDESPMGSGFSRALRQAAWQFLVRPPRIGGKSLIGTWVRIHFTFTPVPTDGG